MRCSRAPEGTESRTHTVRIAAELGEEPSGRRDQYPRHSELEARVGRVRVWLWAPWGDLSLSVTTVHYGIAVFGCVRPKAAGACKRV